MNYLFLLNVEYSLRGLNVKTETRYIYLFDKNRKLRQWHVVTGSIMINVKVNGLKSHFHSDRQVSGIKNKFTDNKKS